jgi:thiamine biosynthesis lipoprotein
MPHLQLYKVAYKKKLFYGGIALLLFACSSEESEQILQGKTMGTTWMVKYIGSPLIQQKIIEDYLQQFNQVASTYINDSEISTLNQSPINKWLPISPQLEEIIKLSITVSKQTDGAFDITVGKAVNYWGFGADNEKQQPKKYEIGYTNIILKKNQLYKKKPIYIDLSAIAKGYAVDKIAEILQSAQINRYLIEIGGEIRTKGKNKKQQFWKVAIEQPNPVQRIIMQTIELKNQAIASSGSYRNFKQYNGKTISHTIDPSTAKPITHNIIASSVISSSTALADAYATAFMVLPIKRSLEISKKYSLSTLLVSGQMGDPSTLKKHYSGIFQP